VPQAVSCLPSKCEALSSNPITAKKEKKSETCLTEEVELIIFSVAPWSKAATEPD
jgi:hypothetical protein